MGDQTMSKGYARRISKADPKGDRRSRTIPLDHPPISALAVERLDSGEMDKDSVWILGRLLQRGDGWVRMTGTLDGKTYYLKYKFSDGDHKGHYVMSVVPPELLPWGLVLLYTKVGEVDRGERTPALDKPYDYT